MWKIIAVYKCTKKVAWGSLDKEIEKAFANDYDGAGTFVAGKVPERDFSGSRKTKRGADVIAEKLKKIKGVKVETYEFSEDEDVYEAGQ